MEHTENSNIDKRVAAPTTSSTLLRDLANGAESSRWTEFIDLYRPVLIYWLSCKQRWDFPSLTPAMYDDIIQDTLVSLMKVFPKAIYNKDRARFRTLLQTILHNRAVDHLKRSKRSKLQFVSNESFDIMQAFDLMEPPGDSKEEEYQRQLWQDLWKLIINRVFKESSFSERSRVIFMRIIEGEPLDDIAAEFNMEKNAIYQLKNRIVKKLMEKVEELKRESDDLLSIISKLENGE